MKMRKLTGKAAILAAAIATFTSYADTNITENVTLMADADWSSLGTVTIDAAAEVNLNGHKLTVSSLAGSGTVTSYELLGDNNEYVKLEYIQSTGTQYIDSGVTPSTDTTASDGNMSTKVKARAAMTSTDQYHFLIGTDTVLNNKEHFMGLFMDGNKKCVGVQYGASSSAPNIARSANNSAALNTVYDIEGGWGQVNPWVTVNGVTATFNRTTRYGINDTLWVFARHVTYADGHEGAQPTSKVKLYSMQIFRPYNAESPVRDYVPAMRLSDNVAGLYDRVNKTFSPSASSDSFIAGPFIGDYSAPGELHVNVAENETFRNSTVTITNTLALYKEGKGTFVSAKQQSYTGGTVVSAGTAQPPDGSDSNTTYCRDRFKAFGTGKITVGQGGTFDLRANYAYYNWIDLAGGTLCNRAVDMTKTTNGGSGFGKMTSDSILDVSRSIVFGNTGTSDLGGKTLTVNIGVNKHLYIHDSTFANGVMDIASGGWFHPTTAINASTVDFKVNSALYLAGALDVHDYEAIYARDDNNGSAALNVHGTFKPSAHNYFYGCTLLGGSSIDLSARTSALPSVSAFTSGGKAISFAKDATVTVKTGGRSGKLISWTAETKPANVDTVTFVRDADEIGPSLKVKEAGLYAGGGLMIIVQ